MRFSERGADFDSVMHALTQPEIARNVEGASKVVLSRLNPLCIAFKRVG